MQEARIELLQRMPVFGGIRADVLQFLLGLCPVVSVPTNEFFFREHDQADSMFVLEAGKAAVLKSWLGQEYFLRTLKEGDCFGEMAVMDLLRAAPPSAQSKIAPQSVFRPPTSIRSTRRI
jgi:CRP-like cAMP-binding protein